LEIDLSEAYNGCIKEIIIKVKNTCTTCKGQGQISNESCANCNGQGFTKVNNAPFEFRTNCSICNGLGKINPITCLDCSGSGMLSGYKEKKIQVQVPCGVDSGINLRMSGQGEESIRGGNPGDLIAHVLVKEHEYFQRDGIDLLVDVPLSFSQLTFGCEVEIPTICDEILTCKIPTGTQSHAKFKLGGKGMKLPNGVYGDMIVTVKVEIPKGITDEYKEAILKLQDFEKNNFGSRRQRWQKFSSKKDK
jgi:molecular chaperone DnaJ